MQAFYTVRVGHQLLSAAAQPKLRARTCGASALVLLRQEVPKFCWRFIGPGNPDIDFLVQKDIESVQGAAAQLRKKKTLVRESNKTTVSNLSQA